MAVGNRTETKSAVTSALVPTLSLAQHITLLNDSLIESAVFRKDAIASETESGGNVTIDYSDKDTATVTTAVNLAVSFTNIENGDVKYLEITKGATNTLTFAGATNVTLYQNFIDTQSTVVPYEVFNKNGVVYVRALLETIIKGDVADIQSGDEFKFPNCKAVLDFNDGLLKKKIPIGDWNMDTTASVAVAHGIADWTKIETVKVLIVADTDNGLYPLAQDLLVAHDPTSPGTAAVSGAYAINANDIVLSRLTSGWYDQGGWDNTSYNRGFIVIEYLP